MLYYIRKYPLSLLIILAVIYLSFFKPPSTDIGVTIPGIDKIVHICMYFGMSGMLWLEFKRAHRRPAPLWHAWTGAFLCPVLFSGIIELLQAYCTTYRGGDWWDFVANTAGALLASLIGSKMVRGKKSLSMDN